MTRGPKQAAPSLGVDGNKDTEVGRAVLRLEIYQSKKTEQQNEGGGLKKEKRCKEKE